MNASSHVLPPLTVTWERTVNDYVLMVRCEDAWLPLTLNMVVTAKNRGWGSIELTPLCRKCLKNFSKSSESHLVSEWIFREIKSMDLDPVEELLASHLLARRVDEMIVDSSGNGEMEGTLQVPRYLNPDRYSDPLF